MFRILFREARMSATRHLLVVLCLTHLVDPAIAENSAGTHFFEQRIRPLLAERCLNCHSISSESIGGNLRLDHREGWSQGGDLGPAIVPGDVEASLLIRAVRRTHETLQMPPDNPLSPHDIALLEQWIEMGAPDPRQLESPDVSSTHRPQDDLWSLKSPHHQAIRLPRVQHTDWPANGIDHFVLSHLEQDDQQPHSPANNRTLIRRVTLDLTGLPPTPAEIDRYLADRSPNAYEAVVDRLLSSPHFGERWGRFWLGVARYADSNGLDENIAHGNAWRYRDYVIASFNHDKSFDRFVREQLAGDLIADELPNHLRNEALIATGFLSLGPKVLAEVDETKMEMDIIDEQVDTVGRAFMGMTLGCARCHDHKFDPIRTEDYYALAGIFKSTKTMDHFRKIARWRETIITTKSERIAYERRNRRIAEIKSELEKSTQPPDVTSAGPKPLHEQLQAELQQLELAQQAVPTAMSVSDRLEPTNLRVHVRGSHLTQTRLVSRGLPKVLSANYDQAKQITGPHSGRLVLANWMVNGQHPLVARVLVNRIWRWLFGNGIVQSTDNFGQLGTPPVSQPLLDWMANRLVDDGWSIKQMVRMLVVSNTYRTRTMTDTELDASESDLPWHITPRRLDAESLRDALLFVSGQLDTTFGGSMLHVNNREFLFDHTSKDATNYASRRRSVYLPVIRNHLFDMFMLFDYADASVTNSDRETTTIAPQAMFLMNSEFMVQVSESFANRLTREHSDPSDQIRMAYRLAYGRLPNSTELQRDLSFLESLGNREQRRADTRASLISFCHAVLLSNEFIHRP